MFKSNIISLNNEKKIIKYLLNIRYPYKEINNKQINHLKSIYPNISKELLESMKSSYIKTNLLIQYAHAKLNSTMISEEYSNTNILKLSEKYKISPINIFRLVLKHRGFDNQSIRNLINNPEALNDYDSKQFELACEYDNYSFVDEDEILKKSLEYEKKIEKILQNNNIKYETQEELVEQQKNEFGKPISTPDFLIKSDLFINNIKINWIEVKNFYGANNNFVVGKIKKQISKYNKNYGTGCLLFKYGYCSKLLNYEEFKNNVIQNL